MSDRTERLISTYQEELELYQEILRLAREGSALAGQGRPLSELHELNLRKRACLSEIAALEQVIARDKAAWRSGPTETRRSRRLEELLAGLTSLIQQILSAERQTDQRIVEAAGLARAQEQT